ncbi:YheC/YheD family protein [Paenibacillus sp. YPG26]|uniref:YheC/YheD family endospore coat-associated protein n=1 Tax=Paenibacillus sp. YPG26 TaxID=2878915 RepID=UPI002041A067|nr:YheC/YheD family protein [Paenibacillus sp. YPG26]USB32395.1 YheC/YheD family protein [Paenibacillus sp. YPG26]
MSSKKVLVQIMNPGLLDEDTIILGEMMVRRWKIPTNRYLQLSFGSFKQGVKVLSLPRYAGIRISQGLAYRMGIFSKPALQLTFKRSASLLRLGPLIGVLISRDYPDSPERPFGSITMFCREMIHACKKQGAYAYFFTTDHIGPDPDHIKGWVYSDGWRQAELPAADVFYNRLTSRKLENKPSVQHFLKEVKSRYGSHFFNEKFLDKTEVFDALKTDPALLRYLPESHLFRNYAMLKSMCSRYPAVFLKPIRGSLGKGIIRISRNPEGTYQTLATQVGGTRRQNFESLSKLFSSLSGKMKTTRYQIQQGLTLINLTGRPVDFRALVQKNRLGNWEITSIVARIAGNQHYVSNLARGGTLSTVKEAVAKTSLPADIKAKAGVRLKKAALDIAAGIEAHIPAHFGELGIDLAMDTAGKVWLLEVNSKPSKNDNTPLASGKVRPSVKRMIDYATYLSSS